ncbi:hypothetical protein MARINOS108_11051 [Marinoscillum sp. 108]|nr:hypothetical protein MARINOS108_11051 [Marinoscillum sp. 108]
MIIARMNSRFIRDELSGEDMFIATGLKSEEQKKARLLGLFCS